MSADVALTDRASAPEICEHYWAWVSPAGTQHSARLCMLCHQPDPVWLNHTMEVDLGNDCDRANCVHCEFGEVRK